VEQLVGAHRLQPGPHGGPFGQGKRHGRGRGFGQGGLQAAQAVEQAAHEGLSFRRPSNSAMRRSRSPPSPRLPPRSPTERAAPKRTLASGSVSRARRVSAASPIASLSLPTARDTISALKLLTRSLNAGSCIRVHTVFLQTPAPSPASTIVLPAASRQ